MVFCGGEEEEEEEGTHAVGWFVCVVIRKRGRGRGRRHVRMEPREERDPEEWTGRGEWDGGGADMLSERGEGEEVLAATPRACA